MCIYRNIIDKTVLFESTSIIVDAIGAGKRILLNNHSEKLEAYKLKGKNHVPSSHTCT